jgi:hypothetical protein
VCRLVDSRGSRRCWIRIFDLQKRGRSATEAQLVAEERQHLGIPTPRRSKP